MSGLFSSPSQQAGKGSSAEMGQLQNIINQTESYVGQQQQSERAGVAGIGNNPYFSAAQNMSPTSYEVNPNQTQTFGATGPGTYLANLSSIQRGQPPAAGGTSMPPVKVVGGGGGGNGGGGIPIPHWPGPIGGGGGPSGGGNYHGHENA
jgi:hypothetical protein